MNEDPDESEVQALRGKSQAEIQKVLFQLLQLLCDRFSNWVKDPFYRRTIAEGYKNGKYKRGLMYIFNFGKVDGYMKTIKSTHYTGVRNLLLIVYDNGEQCQVSGQNKIFHDFILNGGYLGEFSGKGTSVKSVHDPDYIQSPLKVLRYDQCFKICGGDARKESDVFRPKEDTILVQHRAKSSTKPELKVAKKRGGNRKSSMTVTQATAAVSVPVSGDDNKMVPTERCKSPKMDNVSDVQDKQSPDVEPNKEKSPMTDANVQRQPCMTKSTQNEKDLMPLEAPKDDSNVLCGQERRRSQTEIFPIQCPSLYDDIFDSPDQVDFENKFDTLNYEQINTNSNINVTSTDDDALVSFINAFGAKTDDQEE